MLQLAALGATTFVNDVALTRKAAYFTDSRRSVLYVVSTDLDGFSELALPEVPLLEGNNLNGIVATPDQKTLIAVQGNVGNLWRIDPRTGRATRIAVPAADAVNGDGLLLVVKRRLYVVQNRLNRITVMRLSKDLTSATVQRRITSEDFDDPKTVARVGNRLYLPSARFTTPPAAATRYWITQIRR